MPDVPPPHLAPALRRFNDALGELRSTVIRASQIEAPTMPALDPGELERAAAERDAPEQLRAVARAVREGRTSWAEVAAGGGLDVPEIRDLIAASGSRIAGKLAEAEAELAAQEPDTTRHSGRPTRATRPDPDDDEDFSQHRIFRSPDW